MHLCPHVIGPVMASALLLGCVEEPVVNEGTLQVQVTGIVASAAAISVSVTGPRSERRELAVSGDRATVAFELVPAGAYTVSAASSLVAGVTLQRSVEQTATVTAGDVTQVELTLVGVTIDGGNLADASSDRGPIADAGVDARRADAASDAGVDAAIEDAATEDAAALLVPSGRLASGFPLAWNGVADDIDRGHAIAVDETGAAWATGVTYDSHGVVHMALWKFASDGSLAGGFPVERSDGAGDHGDVGLAVAIDGEQVWVAGCGRDSNSIEHLLVWRFDRAGGERAGSPTVTDATVQRACGKANKRTLAIAIDHAGNGWVTGRPKNPANDRDDLGLWKFDPDGTPVAGFPVVRDGDADGAGHSWEDAGAAIAIDADDQVWVTGWSSDPVGNQQLALWRFDQAGALADGFPKIPRPASGQYAMGKALAIDASGDLWVVGRLSPGSYETDAAFWRFDRAGELAPGYPLLWNGAAEQVDEATGVVVDAAGDLWACGTSINGAGNQDFALWHVERRGALAEGFPLLRDDEVGGHFHEYTGSMAIDGAGALWIAGASTNAAMSQDLVIWKFE